MLGQPFPLGVTDRLGVWACIQRKVLTHAPALLIAPAGQRMQQLAACSKHRTGQCGLEQRIRDDFQRRVLGNQQLQGVPQAGAFSSSFGGAGQAQHVLEPRQAQPLHLLRPPAGIAELFMNGHDAMRY